MLLRRSVPIADQRLRGLLPRGVIGVLGPAEAEPVPEVDPAQLSRIGPGPHHGRVSAPLLFLIDGGLARLVPRPSSAAVEAGIADLGEHYRTAHAVREREHPRLHTLPRDHQIALARIEIARELPVAGQPDDVDEVP